MTWVGHAPGSENLSPFMASQRTNERGSVQAPPGNTYGTRLAASLSAEKSPYRRAHKASAPRPTAAPMAKERLDPRVPSKFVLRPN